MQMAQQHLTAFHIAASVCVFHKGLRFARTIYRASRSRMRLQRCRFEVGCGPLLRFVRKSAVLLFNQLCHIDSRSRSA